MTNKLVKQDIQKDEIKEIELEIHEIEDMSVIVNVDGWRMRIYFDDNVKKDNFRMNQKVVAKFKGNREDVHSIRFEKIK